MDVSNITVLNRPSSKASAESELSEEWQNLARCRGRNLEIFYPQRGVRNASAKALCQDCEVKMECLEYAIAHEERFGIWGGLSERERRKIMRERRKIATAS